jgi:hypothetical protein
MDPDYLSGAIQKLGVRNRIEAARLAEEKGWLERLPALVASVHEILLPSHSFTTGLKCGALLIIHLNDPCGMTTAQTQPGLRSKPLLTSQKTAAVMVKANASLR